MHRPDRGCANRILGSFLWRLFTARRQKGGPDDRAAFILIVRANVSGSVNTDFAMQPGNGEPPVVVHQGILAPRVVKLRRHPSPTSGKVYLSFAATALWKNKWQ